MAVWFCSDSHFQHKNICKYTQRKLFTTQESHDDWLVNQWNKTVKFDDTVYHLGDFSFSSDADQIIDLISRLNGTIIFIKGNHCSSETWKRVLRTTQSKFENYLEIKIEQQRIVLCHFPFSVWHNQHYGAWNLYGHCHGSHTPVGKQLDVGFDNAYKLLGEHRPFSFDELLQIMQKQDIIVQDHHQDRTGDSK